MKDFGQWLADAGKDEAKELDVIIYMECQCGKWEHISLAAYKNGDTGWYSEDPESGKGLCGGQFCLP